MLRAASIAVRRAAPLPGCARAQDAYPFPDGGIFGHDFAQTVDAAVGRSIVDEDELRVDVALREQRTGAVGDIALHSVDGNETERSGTCRGFASISLQM